MRSINAEGLDIIKKAEGLRLESYLCPAGVWTIGYGHTKGVKPGMVITEEEAERLLRDDCYTAETAVDEVDERGMNDNQFSACVSLTFNIGVNAFRTSTLLKLWNAGNVEGAAQQFARWNKAGPRVLPGLVKRRAAERDLFLKET